jgi:hypothetical protein
MALFLSGMLSVIRLPIWFFRRERIPDFDNSLMDYSIFSDHDRRRFGEIFMGVDGSGI